MTLGGDDLFYFLGEPLNAYDEPMDVTISGGFADLFIYLDTFNALVVTQDKLFPEYVGTYQVKVTASYQGPKDIVKFTAYFLLTI